MKKKCPICNSKRMQEGEDVIVCRKCGYINRKSKIKKRIAFSIIVLFSFFGLFFISVLFHEFSHKQDFKGIAEKGSMCLLTFPESFKSFMTDTAHYSYLIQPNNRELYEKILKYTELKAYLVSSVITFIFVFSLLYYIFYNTIIQ